MGNIGNILERMFKTPELYITTEFLISTLELYHKYEDLYIRIKWQSLTCNSYGEPYHK